MAASGEMREYFGFADMAHPEDARAWFEALWQRFAFAPEAVDYFRSLRLEVGTLDEPMGGGYWFGDRRLVLLRGTQHEAAVHELAHAWWEQQRLEDQQELRHAAAEPAGHARPHSQPPRRRDALMQVLRELGTTPPAGYPRIAELARVYCHGIPSQVDPSSPTGYWRGMLAEDNDHETFAGFCSGVMADASQLPPALRPFYRGLLTFTGARRR